MKIIAVGDIFLKTKKNGDPFKYVKKYFCEKDILFGNLEVVLSDTGEFKEKAVVLNEIPDKAKYLKDARFDILNIANNHILDLGIIGFDSTIKTLDMFKIMYIGQNYANDNIFCVNNSKIGFLGYNAGKCHEKVINELNPEKIAVDIKNLKKKCDIVIVSLHWGIENFQFPSPQQIKLAHKFIDCGASLILGHHPHVIQGLEKYKEGLIIYSLGNFNFDPILSNSDTNDSMIVIIEFSESQIQNYDIIPINIDENYMPKPVNSDKKAEHINFISQLSDPIIKGKISNNWWYSSICKKYLYTNSIIFNERIKKWSLSALIEFIMWIISPFCIRCYFYLLKNIFKD